MRKERILKYLSNLNNPALTAQRSSLREHWRVHQINGNTTAFTENIRVLLRGSLRPEYLRRQSGLREPLVWISLCSFNTGPFSLCGLFLRPAREENSTLAVLHRRYYFSQAEATGWYCIRIQLDPHLVRQCYRHTWCKFLADIHGSWKPMLHLIVWFVIMEIATFCCLWMTAYPTYYITAILKRIRQRRLSYLQTGCISYSFMKRQSRTQAVSVQSRLRKVANYYCASKCWTDKEGAALDAVLVLLATNHRGAIL